MNDPLSGARSHLVHALDQFDDLLLGQLLQEVVLVDGVADQLLRTAKRIYDHPKRDEREREIEGERETERGGGRERARKRQRERIAP